MPHDLGLAGADHEVVVGRVVGDVARAVLLLDAADTVLKTRRAGHRPRPGQGLRVALVGPEHLGAVGQRVVGAGRELDAQVREFVDLGNPPRLGAVGQVAVREQEDRGAVGQRDACRVDGRVEAVRRGLRRDDRHRRLAVAAVHRLQQVGLLGLGRQARGGAAALDVHDQKRQLQRHRQTDRLRLQRHARTRGGRHGERAAERRTQGRADSGDLVLRLEGAHAEVLVPRQLVQDVRGRMRIGYEPR